MKKFALSLATLALVAPAFADDGAAPNDTITYMVANGVQVAGQGGDYVISFGEDGTFADESGTLSGTWKASGDEHCLSVPGLFEDMCSDYPAGKTGGDTFDIQTDMGPMTVTLK